MHCPLRPEYDRTMCIYTVEYPRYRIQCWQEDAFNSFQPCIILRVTRSTTFDGHKLQDIDIFRLCASIHNLDCDHAFEELIIDWLLTSATHSPVGALHLKSFMNMRPRAVTMVFKIWRPVRSTKLSKFYSHSAYYTDTFDFSLFLGILALPRGLLS